MTRAEINREMRRANIPSPQEKECENCGTQADHRHHEDYTKPTKVNYLCAKCHAHLHARRSRTSRGKLLVRVSCTFRKFYLQPPPRGSNEYHVRFTPPRAVRDKLGIRERIYRTTGFSEIAPAKHVARQIIERYWNVAAVESLKKRESVATLPEIVERYRDGARTIENKEDLDEGTISKNVSSVIRIVEARFDDEGEERRAVGSWERVTVDRLPALFTEFKQGWMRGVDKRNPQALSSAKHTINSYIRQARSIFADEYLALYRDLELPDLIELRRVSLFKKPGSTRYVPIQRGVIEAMEAEIQGLRASRSDLYLAFYLMLRLGMRVSEVVNARREWIEEWPTIDGGTIARMAIAVRPYFKPKGIEGSVIVAPEFLAEIRELSGAVAPLDYLIPGVNRRKAVGRELSAIIRRHLGGDRRKTCHELRKHAISTELMRTRNYVDALKFSRHSDVRTLQNHYATFLDNLPPVGWRAA
jgi:integrase